MTGAPQGGDGFCTMKSMRRERLAGTTLLALCCTLSGMEQPDRLSEALAFLRGGSTPERCSPDDRRKTDAVCALYRDAEPPAGELRRDDNGAQIWMRRLKHGEVAFALVNRGKRPAVIDVIWKEHGLKGSPRVWDAFTGANRGKVHGGFGERVEPGGASLLRVKP